MDFSHLAAMAASLTDAPAPNTYWERDVVATIQNRFGTFDFTEEQVITLHPGLVGFSGFSRFAMAPLPSGDGRHDFRLLQSLDEADLSFIVYPTTAMNALLEETDVAFLADEYGIRADDLLLLHIATVRPGSDGQAAMTLNVKAPIVVNAYLQHGTQHVLHSNKYSTQMPMGEQRRAA